ncbi:MAG TPA: hypothetical protein VGF32_26455, partial [Streptosporangiaceae bacterium]
LRAGPGRFELTVIGNAFHRLRRALVAERARGWLEPGGCLALCWSTSPWAGPRDWQQTLDRVVRRWQDALGASGRVPSGWDQPEFDADLAAELSRYTAGGRLTGTVSFACELARKPAPA